MLTIESKPLASHEGECPRVYAISTEEDGPFLFLNDNLQLANDHADKIYADLNAFGPVTYVMTTRQLVGCKGNTGYLKDSISHTDLPLFSGHSEVGLFINLICATNRAKAGITDEDIKRFRKGY